MSEADTHYFRVQLNGRALLLELEPGQIKSGGFVTTRIITADTKENAIVKASAGIKLDPDLSRFVRNPVDSPYVVTVDAIEEVDEFVDLRGFTFYTVGSDASRKGIFGWLKNRLGLKSIKPVD